MTWIARQWERLRWRAEFLLNRRSFSLSERVAYIHPFGEKIRLDDLLLGRLRRTPEGEGYFDMNGRRILFRPRWSISSHPNDCGFLGGEAQHPKLVALLRAYGYRIGEVAQKHILAW